MKIQDNSHQDISKLQADLQERRALPIGRTQFNQWVDRIIEGASIEGVTRDSQIQTLIGMLCHLGTTEAFKEDGYFVLGLRHQAVVETATYIFQEIQDAKKKRLEAEKIKAAATAPTPLRAVDGLLANQELQSVSETVE